MCACVLQSGLRHMWGPSGCSDCKAAYRVATAVGGEDLQQHRSPNCAPFFSPSHRCRREKAVFSTHAHVFQIDPQTKKRWLPASANAVRVSFYHDPERKTYRIIAIENSKVW